MTGVYVHIPFCKKKCKYCDFISFDDCNQEIKEKYIESLIKDIQSCDVNREISTIYIGGGTPSIVNVEDIDRILREIHSKFGVLRNAEITIEVNPGTVDFDKLKLYKNMGINRLSIGLQSTHDRLLNLLGRIHKYEDFEIVYKNARNVRF